MTAHILCTLPLHPTGLELLKGKATISVLPSPDTHLLARYVSCADYLVVRTLLPTDVFETPNRLRGVVRHGTGLDFIPVEAATARGIPVANVPGANTQAVVEYCAASLLTWARRTDVVTSRMRTHGWDDARRHATGATELCGKTIGIVGVGSIGAKLANLCAHGFGMRVLGYQRRLEILPEFVHGVDLDSLIVESDYVVLTCPLTETTHRLMNSDRLSRMKPHAVLVNAARGAVIDEDALVTALRHGRLRGASLDVFATQPLPDLHPLRELDNVLITPHVGGITEESTAAMSVGTAKQLLQLMAGQRPTHLVNPEVWDRAMTRRLERFSA